MSNAMPGVFFAKINTSYPWLINAVTFASCKYAAKYLFKKHLTKFETNIGSALLCSSSYDQEGSPPVA